MECSINNKLVILGGGQLALMMVQAANRLGIITTVLSTSLDCPCSYITEVLIIKSYSLFLLQDYFNLQDSYTLTFDLEGIDLSLHDSSTGLIFDTKKKIICPSINCLSIIQDKLNQKQFFLKNNIPTAVFSPTLCDFSENLFPASIKSRFGSYDGRGVTFVNSKSQAVNFFSNADHYIEECIRFDAELSVIVVRRRCTIKNVYDDKAYYEHSNCRYLNSNGVELFHYPVTESFHSDGILHISKAPANLHPYIKKEAEYLACKTIAALPVQVGYDGRDMTAGVFCVELFLILDGKMSDKGSEPKFRLLVNEICCRPHNTGHYTMDTCIASQFEQHLRCILSIPLKSTTMKKKYALMINVLGNEEVCTLSLLNYILTKQKSPENVHIYTYRKKNKERRKLGHINIVGYTIQEVKNSWLYLMKYKWFRDDFMRTIDNNTLFSWDKIADFQVASRTLDITSDRPLVGIIMGSISDLKVMKDASSLLSKMQIPFEMTIVSAHRTPDRLYEYAKSIMSRGIKVIIAGAGGAAHLPGMVSSLTSVPVIGVPIKSRALFGLDSLLSIVQMPPDIPVATMAIDNSKNAAVLAARILGLTSPSILNAVKALEEEYKENVFKSIEHLDKEEHCK